jgi:large subunit ribosomal protein L13Ae
LTPILENKVLIWSNRLEERRKVKGKAYYERKKALTRQIAESRKTATVKSKTKKQLAEYGY